MDDLVLRFLRIINHEDQEYASTSNQGWDEFSNINLWSKSLDDDQLSILIRGICDLLEMEESDFREALRSRGAIWGHKPRDFMLCGLVNIEGYDDWRFLMSYLLSKGTERPLSSKCYALDGLGKMAEAIPADEVAPKLRDYFTEFWEEWGKKSLLARNVDAKSVYISLSNCVGRIEGPKGLSLLSKCLSIDSVLSVFPGTTVGLLCGISISPRFDALVFNSICAETLSGLSKKERKLLIDETDWEWLLCNIRREMVESIIGRKRTETLMQKLPAELRQ